MKKDKRALDGRSFPSSTVDANAPSPQHLRISDFQSPYNNSVPQMAESVNTNYGSKSFIEALSDRDKSKALL